MKISNSIKFLLVSIFFFIGMSIADAKTFDLSYKNVDFSNVNVPESVDFCIMQYNDSNNYIYVTCYEYAEIYFEFGNGIVLAKSGGNPAYPISFINYYYNKNSKTWSLDVDESPYGKFSKFCVYDESYLYLRCKEFYFGNFDVLLALSTDIKYKDSNDVYMYKDSYEPFYNIPWVDDYDEYTIEEENIITNVYSVDFYLERGVNYENKNFKIKMQKDDVSRIFGEAFNFYGLVNDNGLYHWEEISAYDTGCAVDDYIESYSSNSEYIFEIKGLTSECSNLFNTYEEIYFKVIFANAYELDKIIVTSPVLDFYINIYSDLHIIQKFNTMNFKYINFTTTLSQWPSEYDFAIKLFEDVDIYFKLYVDLFDTKTKKFKEHLVPGNIGNYDRERYNIHKYYINFGQSSNTGFWLTWLTYSTQKEIEDFSNFEFLFAYVPYDLYFSINARDGTNENNNTIIVDENGTSQRVDLESDYVPSSNNSFGINSLAKGIDSAHLLYSTFYNSLPSEYKILHNVFFTLLMVVIFVKVVLK